MVRQSLLVLLLSHVLAAHAGLAARQAMLKNQYGIEQQLQKRHSQPSFPNQKQFLNKRTEPYWVNGTALPEVDFGMESRAGALLCQILTLRALQISENHTQAFCRWTRRKSFSSGSSQASIPLLRMRSPSGKSGKMI